MTLDGPSIYWCPNIVFALRLQWVLYLRNCVHKFTQENIKVRIKLHDKEDLTICNVNITLFTIDSIDQLNKLMIYLVVLFPVYNIEHLDDVIFRQV